MQLLPSRLGWVVLAMQLSPLRFMHIVQLHAYGVCISFMHSCESHGILSCPSDVVFKLGLVAGYEPIIVIYPILYIALQC